MSKILVTGSNGQLGNELRLLSVFLPDHEFLFHDVDTLDITSEKALENFFRANKPDFVVNCAAYTAVDKAESELDKAYLINDKAVENLAKLAGSNTKIIHVSTDYVFDGLKGVPYIEKDTTNPVSAYGKSKLAGEKHLDENSNAMIIRTAWLYSSFGANFVKTMIRLGKEKTEIKVVADQVGTPTYAADLAKAIMQILKVSVEDKSAFVPGIYHFANEGACSWFDLASEIMQQVGLNCKVIPIETREYPTPATRPPYSVFNKSKIKTTFGIEIPWWKESLKNCLAVMKNNL
jgi:dTDP-4-dehydrorhamnose reductase